MTNCFHLLSERRTEVPIWEMAKDANSLSQSITFQCRSLRCNCYANLKSGLYVVVTIAEHAFEDAPKWILKADFFSSQKPLAAS